MRRGSFETAVGAVVIAIAVIFAMFTYNVTNYGGKTGYLLFAEFNHVGSIKTGSDVKVCLLYTSPSPRDNR